MANTLKGLTRSDLVVRALDSFRKQAGEVSLAYSLAADLIPEKGAKKLQSGNARALARKAFGFMLAR